MKIPYFYSTQDALNFADNNMTKEAVISLIILRKKAILLHDKIEKIICANRPYNSIKINRMIKISFRAQLCREALERIQMNVTKMLNNSIAKINKREELYL